MARLTTPERALAELFPTYADRPWLQVAVIIVAATLGTWLVALFLDRVVARLAARTRTEADDKVVEAVHWPIRVLLLAVGFGIGVERLQLEPEVVSTVRRALLTVVLVFWTVASMRVAEVLLRGLARRHRRGALVSGQAEPLFENVVKVAVLLLGGYAALRVWSFDISGLLAAGGIAGLAIGFAARDTLANVFAGVFIFADRPYEVGDFVTLDTGERGVVTQIGLRSTRLLTRDDVGITIPNAVIGNAKINNESGGRHVKYRLRIRVGIAYDSDVQRVEAIQLGVARENDKVCSEPEPRVRFRAFGPSAFEYELLCWIEEPVHRGIVVHELLTGTHRAFAQAGIEIPFNQHDVHIKESCRARSGDVQSSIEDAVGDSPLRS